MTTMAFIRGVERFFDVTIRGNRGEIRLAGHFERSVRVDGDVANGEICTTRKLVDAQGEPVEGFRRYIDRSA
jgi:hypothetical protein